MAGTEVEESKLVVFDVSLLSPESHEMVQSLLDEGNLKFVATIGMLEVWKDLGKHRGLLRLWGIDTRYAELILEFLRRVRFFEKVKPVAIADLPEKKFLGPLKEAIRENKVVLAFEDFLAEEMCLAFAGYPVFCTASSKWKIVEFFEKIGAKVKKIVHARLKEKGEMLKTKRFRNMVLAKGLGAAFVYVLIGPLAAFVRWGDAVIELVIVDG